jgi:protein tyrosine phosphatase
MSRTHLFTPDETEMHLKHLKDTLWMDAVTRRVERGSNVYFRVVSPRNLRKNIWLSQECNICVLVYESEVFLGASSSNKENTLCWNRLGAISVDAFRCPNKFLVVRQPTSNTLTDFWDLVVEKNISVILTLNEITGPSIVSQVESKGKKYHNSCIAERSLCARKEEIKSVFEPEC